MIGEIEKVFDYIKANDAYIKKAKDAQISAWRGEKNDMPVLTLTCSLTEEQNKWLPGYNPKEIHFDSEKMFANGLRDVLTAINGNCGAVPSMRANMGCGIIPSLFGNEQRLFDDKMPWLLDHVKKETIEGMSKDHSFNINGSEEFFAAMTHMDYLTEKLRDGGLDGKVFVYPLDLQGPIDSAHLVYGDTIFYDFYDDPEFAHHLLKLSNKSVYFAMDECFKRMDQSDELVTHYNAFVLPSDVGTVKISEDTTTLLSPALIDEFAQPYLHEMLGRFNGGYVHYCGKNDYLLDVLLKEPLACGINFGNPDKHDMTEVLKRCRDSKKLYIGAINRQAGEELSDYFGRILEPSYDRETGRFYVILQYWCAANEREHVIGEFERAAENVMKL